MMTKDKIKAIGPATKPIKAASSSEPLTESVVESNYSGNYFLRLVWVSDRHNSIVNKTKTKIFRLCILL